MLRRLGSLGPVAPHEVNHIVRLAHPGLQGSPPACRVEEVGPERPKGLGVGYEVQGPIARSCRRSSCRAGGARSHSHRAQDNDPVTVSG